MMFNEKATEIHNDNVQKGFWENKETKNVGELLMLVVSELAEALEAHRKGRFSDWNKYNMGIAHGDIFETYIKDTFEDEIADAVIRLLDLSGGLGIDLDLQIDKKLQYNRNRPHKHGKAY